MLIQFYIPTLQNINWRARDDVDLEVTIRPRSNAPDVVRSAIGPREKISEHTIDKLLAAPSKILIPERYVPEQAPELSPEEKRRRQEKVEAIKKMLSETPIAGNVSPIDIPGLSWLISNALDLSIGHVAESARQRGEATTGAPATAESDSGPAGHADEQNCGR